MKKFTKKIGVQRNITDHQGKENPLFPARNENYEIQNPKVDHRRKNLWQDICRKTLEFVANRHTRT